MSAVVRELSSASVVLATGLAALNLSTTSALRPSRLSSACSPSSSLDAVGHGPARKPTGGRSHLTSTDYRQKTAVGSASAGLIEGRGRSTVSDLGLTYNLSDF
jgi:hypothetical protein